MKKNLKAGDLVLLKKHTPIKHGHPTKVLLYECNHIQPNWGKIFHINQGTVAVLIQKTLSGNYWKILIGEKLSWTFRENLEKI